MTTTTDPDEGDRKCLECERYISKGHFCWPCRERFEDPGPTTMEDRMLREKP